MGETTEATMARAPPPSKPSSAHNHPPYAEQSEHSTRTRAPAGWRSTSSSPPCLLRAPPVALGQAHGSSPPPRYGQALVEVPNKVKNAISGEKRGRGRPPKTISRSTGSGSGEEATWKAEEGGGFGAHKIRSALKSNGEK